MVLFVALAGAAGLGGGLGDIRGGMLENTLAGSGSRHRSVILGLILVEYPGHYEIS